MTKLSLVLATPGRFILLLSSLTVGLLLPASVRCQESAAQAPPVTVAELQQRLTALVEEERFNAGMWGIKVAALDTGKVLFAVNEEKLFSPASNCKLYTMAMVLDKLGGDYRIKTSLYSNAKPDRRGNLKGDLIIYGRGDPGINTKFNRGDIYRALQPLVAALTNAGVRSISGDLIADDSFMVGSPYGSGWVWDDMNYYYGAEISALTINDNTLEVAVTPGENPGEPCQLATIPPSDYVVLNNRTRTISADGKRKLIFYRPVEENVIYVSGILPTNETNYSETVTFHRPAGAFASFFREALARNGVKVSGKSRVVGWLDRQGVPLDTDKLIELGFIESAPMREIDRWVQKPSQNLYTDLMLAHVGSLEREEALRDNRSAVLTPENETVVGTLSSEDYGLRALETFLAKAGVKKGEVRFEEGSGLSRNNVATPNATVALLEFMSRHAEAKTYHDALPIAGVDGTLRRRMKGTRAENNLHGKTGTLRWANSLSGYVTTAAGEKLVFSLMLNRYAAPSSEFSARAELDRIAVMLAGFTGRSDQ